MRGIFAFMVLFSLVFVFVCKVCDFNVFRSRLTKVKTFCHAITIGLNLNITTGNFSYTKCIIIVVQFDTKFI